MLCNMTVEIKLNLQNISRGVVGIILISISTPNIFANMQLPELFFFIKIATLLLACASIYGLRRFISILRRLNYTLICIVT